MSDGGGAAELKWGVWGGQIVPGWCSIDVETGGNWRNSAYEGTKEEAERQAEGLRRAYPDVRYDVLPFDPDREPEENPGPYATAAQKRALEIVDRTGDLYATKWRSATPIARAVAETLMDRGWVMWKINRGQTPDMRHRAVLTKAGRKILERRRKK